MNEIIQDRIPCSPRIYFHAYTGLSIAATVSLVLNAVQVHGNFFDVVVDLTSSKLNLVVFLNCLVAILCNLYYIFVWVFFG
jgi:hypothetical protein